MFIEQLIPTLMVVNAILGPAMPDTGHRVARVERPRSFSVYQYDNITDLTNRVLDRSIRTDSVRVVASLTSPEMYTDASQWTPEEKNKATIQQASQEENCKARLRADGTSGETTKCGPGFARFRIKN